MRRVAEVGSEEGCRGGVAEVVGGEGAEVGRERGCRGGT